MLDDRSKFWRSAGELEARLESLRRELEKTLTGRREVEEEGARLKSATEVGVEYICLMDVGCSVVLTARRRVLGFVGRAWRRVCGLLARNCERRRSWWRG